jgi:hypothetical protein
MLGPSRFWLPGEKLPCSKELLRKFFARAFSPVARKTSPIPLSRNPGNLTKMSVFRVRHAVRVGGEQSRFDL